jgi:hypothetical protein
VSHNNPSKEIGTNWERTVADYLRYVHGFRGVDRLPLKGRRDVGDIQGLPDFLIGCKNEKTIRLSTYMNDLRKQKGNLIGGEDVVPVEIVKRRGSATGKAYVVCELDEFIPVLRRMSGEET